MTTPRAPVHSAGSLTCQRSAKKCHAVCAPRRPLWHWLSPPACRLPGWLDTAGNQIEAHGGNIIKLADTYHWYGATKKDLTYKGKPCVFECSLGINLYTSSDLLVSPQATLCVACDFEIFSESLLVIVGVGLRRRRV